MSIFYALFFNIGLFLSVTHASQIFASGLDPKTIDTPRLYNTYPSFNGYGNISIADPFSACEELNNEKTPGLILLVEQGNLSPFLESHTIKR